MNPLASRQAISDHIKTFQYNEKYLSQIPAIRLLINLGFESLSPAEALRERQGRTSNLLLEGILSNQLKLSIGYVIKEESTFSVKRKFSLQYRK